MPRKLIFILMATFGLFACSEHDLPYYQSNLDKAESKVKECEAALKEAFSAKDKDQLKVLSEDLECKAAKQAHTEYQRELSKLEQKKRAEERLKQRELEQAQYEEEVEKYTKELTEMPIADFYAIRKECSLLSFGQRPAKCKAFDEIKEAKVTAELDVLIKKYEGEKLSEYNQEQCKGINYNEVNCDLSREAVKKQRQDQIDYYLTNRDALKSAFNTCQAQYAELKKARKLTEARQYVQTFECSVVADAARKLKVYDFSKPIG
ncbi:hypothetical protein [Shewanella algae]|uniref:hypothetical protein n=1 Tax=Shewanella algae TaxID=38313 RepID=UPI0031F4C0BD